MKMSSYLQLLTPLLVLCLVCSLSPIPLYAEEIAGSVESSSSEASEEQGETVEESGGDEAQADGNTEEKSESDENVIEEPAEGENLPPSEDTDIEETNVEPAETNSEEPDTTDFDTEPLPLNGGESAPSEESGTTTESETEITAETQTDTDDGASGEDDTVEETVIPESVGSQDEDNDATDESEVTADETDTVATTTPNIDIETTATSTMASSIDEVATTTDTSTDVGTTTAEGDVSIKTGNAIALANILNLINSNFINSEGIVLFKNFFETLFQDFDLRQFFNGFASSGCSLTSCQNDEVHTNIENGAIIDNELYVEAITGGNTVDGSENAIIDTGNAYAGVNLINIANTNVIDSNYLLVSINAFEDVNGDIVFPSLYTFLSSIKGSSPATLDIENIAQVNNNVTLDAQTGNNSVDGASSSTISTGASTAGTNIFNQLNSTLAGGQNIAMIFRVHGDWAGEIFGAPQNLKWMETGDGGIYVFDTAGPVAGGNVHVHATNSATISNNVHVVALTGENAISGSETALISTGNALAGANIMNVANATVIGRNWIMAIVNIFGDFNGNIAFGRPDLWIGGQVEVPGKIKNGSELLYTITVMNNGDSKASQVLLKSDYDAERLEISDASSPYTIDEEGNMLWELPELMPGEAAEITYRGKVRNAGYSADIESLLTVASHETDNNISDNTDVLVVTTASKGRGSKRITRENATTTSTNASVEDAITVERLTSATNVHRGESESVMQRILVENTTGSSLGSVVFRDVLKEPSGKILHEEIWELGDVLPYESIELTYTIEFMHDAPNGLYMLGTHIESGDKKFIKENNGSVLLWGSFTKPDLLIANVPTVLGITTAFEPDRPSIFESILPKIALASEAVDIRTTRDEALLRKFALTGTMLLLLALTILYAWWKPEWSRTVRRKITEEI